MAFECADISGRTTTQADGFLPATYVGSALLLVRRETLVLLSESDQLAAYDHDAPWLGSEPSGWTLFDPIVDPGTRTDLSEDYAFCHRWRAVGGTIWVDI